MIKILQSNRGSNAVFTNALRRLGLVYAVLVTTLAVFPGTVYTQTTAREIPANSHMQAYRDKWECDQGYREIDDSCVAVEVPANAYPTNSSHGQGWECNYGYKAADKGCVAIEIPANAYLYSDRGDGWKCNRAYKKVGTTCVAIMVPANGYLRNSSYGADWECERGYKAVNDACVAIKVPENGYLSDSSAEFGWKCDRGYQAVKDACVAVTMPDNAHLDYSGNNWTCNRPYRRQYDNICQPCLSLNRKQPCHY